MWRIRSLLAAALIIGGAAGGFACAPNPTAAMDMAQATYDNQDAIVDLRAVTSELQAQIDSLRTELEKQDSVIRKIANQIGMPLPFKLPPTMIIPPQ